MISMSAAAMQPAAKGAALPSFARTLARAAMACFVSCFTILLSAGRAFAASTATRQASSSIFSGDVIKYVALGGVIVAGSFFSQPKGPTFVETVSEDGMPVVTEEPASLDGTPPPAVSADAAGGDDMLFSSLQGRMQQLAEERIAAEERGDDPDAEQPPSDSTDTWAEGSTAVLEPPKPDDERPLAGVGGGVLDGPPAVDFPTGFPIIDGEAVEVEAEPAASDEQIAMLKRMMGGAE